MERWLLNPGQTDSQVDLSRKFGSGYDLACVAGRISSASAFVLVAKL